MAFVLALTTFQLIGNYSEHNYFLMKLILSRGLGIFFLISYWQGYGWIRYFFLFCFIIEVLTIGPQLGHSHFGSQSATFAPADKIVVVMRLGFSAYMLYWLLSKEARRYFSTDARHERQSLASYRAFQAKQQQRAGLA